MVISLFLYTRKSPDADFGSPYEGLVPAGKDEGHLLLLEHLGVVEHPVDVEG